MRVRLRMKGFLIVPALCLAGVTAAAQQQGSSQQQTGDPVADAARKAREAKKDAPKPKRVYTDDDLKKNAPAPDAAATSTPGNASGTTATTTAQAAGDATKTAADPNGEAAWKKRFKDLRDKIARTEKELDILGRELEKAQLEYYPDPQKAMTQQNSRADINEKTAKIDAKKKELDQLKQELDDLEDQLRKAGGDPGWAR
jgi:predicted RNase H-like nuclease (RuvC/YqgF family)